MNTDAFGPYLELLDWMLRPATSARRGQSPLLRELLRGSLAGTNAQKMARRALAPVTPSGRAGFARDGRSAERRAAPVARAFELARNLGAQAGKAFSSRAHARGPG